MFALAVGLAFLAQHRRTSDEKHEYQTALGFAGAAYGLLLGLLVVNASGHYSETRHEAENEANSLVALWDTVGVYPQETKDTVRHDLLCYMRAIVDHDWPAMERGSQVEDPRTLAFGDQVRADIRKLPVDDARESSAYGRASTIISDAGESRQQLLFFTEPEVPTVLWVLIYLGAFVLVFLLATFCAGIGRDRIAALGSVAIFLTMVVIVLTMLDNPFDTGAQIQPDSMRDAIELVSVDEDAAVLRPCPENP